MILCMIGYVGSLTDTGVIEGSQIDFAPEMLVRSIINQSAHDLTCLSNYGNCFGKTKDCRKYQNELREL